MRTVLTILLNVITATACALRPGGTKKLVSENLALKQQLIVLNRGRRKAPNLMSTDRVLLALCTLFIGPDRITRIAVVVRPSTLLRFHRHLVKRKYSRLFTPRTRAKPGPKGPSNVIIELVLELKRRNPTFGSPRIASIVNDTLGVDIDKDVVRRILAQHCSPLFTGTDGPSWLTFFADAIDSVWSMDLFRCESIHLKTHWVLVVMDIYSRGIVGFAVQLGSVDGPALCAMFARAIGGTPPPDCLTTDNDPLFRYHRWHACLRVLEIDEIKSVPFVPQSHRFVERLIGTIRREYLDQTWFWTAADLESKLARFADYYNEYRVHAGICNCRPNAFGQEQLGSPKTGSTFRWRDHLNGRYQLPMAA